MTGKRYFAYRSFLPEPEATAEFARIGVNTICLFPANTVNSLGQPYSGYPPHRFWFNTWDFAPVARQIEEALAQMPAARLLLMIDLNSPDWLARQIALSHHAGDSTTHLTEALANPRWIEDTESYLDAFLDFCESRWSDRIDAYIPACGNTDEWFDHNGESCGLLKERAYRQDCRDRGLPETPPPSAEKLNTPDFDGLLFDPAVSGDVITYRRFCNRMVADGICRFARRVKSRVRRAVEEGVFFGYLNDRIGAAESGHVFLERLLQSPEVDFLISPGCYCDRAMGGGSGWQSISGAERLSGKRHFHECDQRTHTYNQSLSPHVKLTFPCWQNLTEDIAGIRREAALAIVNRSSLWWFDMWGGFYRLPEQREAIRQAKQLYDRLIDTPSVRVDQIAMIVDPDAIFYFDQRSPRQGDFQRHARIELNHTGAPFDTYLLSDLPKIEKIERYRLIVLANQLEITPAKAELLRRWVYCFGRTVLALYAPGISDGEALDPARVRTWAGVPYGTPGLSVTDAPDCKIAYLHDPAALTAAMLRELAAAAGVRFPVSAAVPVYADGGLLGVHFGTPVRAMITLPEGVCAARELFSGREFAEPRFEWDSPGCETLLFELNPQQF